MASTPSSTASIGTWAAADRRGAGPWPGAQPPPTLLLTPWRRLGMTEAGAALAAAREAAHRGNWPEALAAFETLPDACPLTADDHAAWADAAWWLGRVDECIAAYDRAFHRYLDAHLARDAAMTALGIAANFLLR